MCSQEGTKGANEMTVNNDNELGNYKIFDTWIIWKQCKDGSEMLVIARESFEEISKLMKPKYTLERQIRSCVIRKFPMSALNLHEQKIRFDYQTVKNLSKQPKKPFGSRSSIMTTQTTDTTNPTENEFKIRGTLEINLGETANQAKDSVTVKGGITGSLNGKDLNSIANGTGAAFAKRIAASMTEFTKQNPVPGNVSKTKLYLMAFQTEANLLIEAFQDGFTEQVEQFLQTLESTPETEVKA
jgi:hypothetical protein